MPTPEQPPLFILEPTAATPPPYKPRPKEHRRSKEPDHPLSQLIELITQHPLAIESLNSDPTPNLLIYDKRNIGTFYECQYDHATEQYSTPIQLDPYTRLPELPPESYTGVIVITQNKFVKNSPSAQHIEIAESYPVAKPGGFVGIAAYEPPPIDLTPTTIRNYKQVLNHDTGYQITLRNAVYQKPGVPYIAAIAQKPHTDTPTQTQPEGIIAPPKEHIVFQSDSQVSQETPSRPQPFLKNGAWYIHNYIAPDGYQETYRYHHQSTRRDERGILKTVAIFEVCMIEPSGVTHSGIHRPYDITDQLAPIVKNVTTQPEQEENDYPF